LVTVGGWDCKGIFNASRTFRPERGRFRGCITCEKIAAFHISDEMLEAISEKSSRKKVTAKLPEQQKSLYFLILFIFWLTNTGLPHKWNTFRYNKHTPPFGDLETKKMLGLEV
jgi:hypothetical protein